MRREDNINKCDMAGGEYISSDEEVAITIHVVGGSACDLIANMELGDSLLHIVMGKLIDSIYTVCSERTGSQGKSICENFTGMALRGRAEYHGDSIQLSTQSLISACPSDSTQEYPGSNSLLKAECRGFMVDDGAYWICNVHEAPQSRTQAWGTCRQGFRNHGSAKQGIIMMINFVPAFRCIEASRFAGPRSKASQLARKHGPLRPFISPSRVHVQTRKQRERKTIGVNEPALTESSEGSSLYLCAGGGPRSGWTTAVMVGPRPSQRTQRMKTKVVFIWDDTDYTRNVPRRKNRNEEKRRIGK